MSVIVKSLASLARSFLPKPIEGILFEFTLLLKHYTHIRQHNLISINNKFHRSKSFHNNFLFIFLL